MIFAVEIQLQRVGVARTVSHSRSLYILFLGASIRLVMQGLHSSIIVHSRDQF